jgi:hypothetical protein
VRLSLLIHSCYFLLLLHIAATYFYFLVLLTAAYSSYSLQLTPASNYRVLQLLVTSYCYLLLLTASYCFLLLLTGPGAYCCPLKLLLLPVGTLYYYALLPLRTTAHYYRFLRTPIKNACYDYLLLTPIAVASSDNQVVIAVFAGKQTVAVPYQVLRALANREGGSDSRTD